VSERHRRPIVKLGDSLLRSAVSLPAPQDAADAARWRFVRSAFELVQDRRRGKMWVICGSQWPVGEVYHTVDDALDAAIASRGKPGDLADKLLHQADLAIQVCEHHLTLGCIACGAADPDCDCDEAGEG
jgi:hypothetical protein